jgi:hypothetical protein
MTLNRAVVVPSERSCGRPSKLSEETRRQMRIDRAAGLTAKVIAAKYQMSVTQTRVIVRDVPCVLGMPTRKATANV